MTFIEFITGLIELSFEFAKEKGHDPLRGHRPADAGKWKSCFLQEDPIPDIKQAVMAGAEVVLTKQDALCIIKVTMPDIIGDTTLCPPGKDSVYEIRYMYGSVQAVGSVSPVAVPTNVATFVIVDEQGTLVLATVFPGESGVLPEEDNGSERVMPTAEQLRTRNSTRIVRE